MAGGLWARKFNYKEGETRTCETCGRVWHTMKPRLSCNLCYNERSKLAQRKRKEEGKGGWVKKAKYPFHTERNGGWDGSAKQHFGQILRRNNEAWKGGREALTRFYSEIFEEIEKNGIMEWILDRRDNETLNEKRKKRDSKIIKDFPDTRGIYEDEQ